MIVQQEKKKQEREIVKFMQHFAHVFSVPRIILHSTYTYSDDPLLTHLKIYKSMFPDSLVSVQPYIERTVIGDNLLSLQPDQERQNIVAGGPVTTARSAKGGQSSTGR